MAKVVALVEFQVRVTDWPGVMVLLDACKLAVGRGAEVGEVVVVVVEPLSLAEN